MTAIINNIKEQIQLKNDVKTKGRLMFKQRYAVLTLERFLLYENKERFLLKREPRVVNCS